MKQLFRYLAIIACASLFDSTAFSEEVNIFTHRHYPADEQIYKMFEEQTGIKVNWVNDEADKLLERLSAEGKNSKVDVLITVDAGRLYRAKKMELLQKIDSEILTQNIPQSLRDPEGCWYALTMRARILVYSRARVKPEEISTYAELADSKWKGRVLVRSSQHIYNISFLAAMIARQGRESAKNWAIAITQNMARTPKGGDRDQIKGVAAGIGDIAIANSYYLGKLISGDELDKAAIDSIGIVFPDQNGEGTHVNISGAGVTKYAPNRENAIKFIEFMVEKEAQSLFSEANYEYPVRTDVEPSPIVKSWGDFKHAEMDLNQLGEYQMEALKVFDEAGWR